MSLLTDTIRRIGPLDRAAMEVAQSRQDVLTKPRGSLGRLEEIASRVAGMTGNARPVCRRRTIYTLAADHGVASEGVSAYPREVTAQMVRNFLAGGAAINVLARHAGIDVVVVDLGVAVDLGSPPGLVSRRQGPGTRNMLREPAMTREQALAAVEAGIGLVGEVDLVGTGDMGIGNTTASSAILAAVTGCPVEEATGRGTGVDDATFERKKMAVRRALEIHRPDPRDGLDVAAKVGGFEIAGLAGVILGAAARRSPVVLDGFISGAAALLAVTLCPQVCEYLFAAHLSAERGHAVCLQWLKLRPILDLDLRLGEGTGAALAMSVVDAACKILDEMATFESAGVSGPR